VLKWISLWSSSMLLPVVKATPEKDSMIRVIERVPGQWVEEGYRWVRTVVTAEDRSVVRVVWPRKRWVPESERSRSSRRRRGSGCLGPGGGVGMDIMLTVVWGDLGMGVIACWK